MQTPPPPAQPMGLRYDRGTVVFTEAPPRLLAQRFGVMWDARTSVYRAPPWRHPEIVAALREAGALEDDAPRFSALSRNAWSSVELRAYQSAALSSWEAGGRRGLLVMPTGSGKTRVAIAAIAAVGRSTLCLVPTRVLLHQWRLELERFYAGRVGVWGDGEHEPAPLMVTTFESAYRHMARWGNRYELLVVDEAHHFGNAARDEALEMAIAPYRLGLTATPPADPAALHRLGHLIGPVTFRTSVSALSGKYLADFEVVVLHIPLEPDERARYEAARAAFRRFFDVFRRIAPLAPWRDFLATANKSAEGRAAVAAWHESRRIIAYTRGKAATVKSLLAEHRGSRVLVFTAGNDAAYTIARQNLIMPLTCDIQRTERDHVLERFRSGELRALVSARVLNEGIDVPDADVAIIVGGTQGQREHVQRVGRLLRPAAGKRATVYELVADDTTEMRQARQRRLGLL